MGTTAKLPPIGSAIYEAIYREVFWAIDLGEQEQVELTKIAEAATDAVHRVLLEYGVVKG